MIKLFGGEYSVNKKESQLKCTKDILDTLNIPYVHVKDIKPHESWDIAEIITQHKDSLNKNDLIVIDNFSHHDGNPNKVLDKFKDLKFLIFCYDLVAGIEEEHLYHNTSEKNYQVVSPVVFDIDNKDSFNYYAWNYSKSTDLDISRYLFDSFSKNLKDKKFIAPFGFLRWDRFLTYQSLIQSNNINDGWVSFSMKYNYGQEDWTFFENQLEGFDISEDDVDMKLLEETKNKIPFSFDRNTSNDFIKKYSENSFANSNARLELLYRHNSYVGVVNDTQPANKVPFYTSEKLWKPFLTFQFPFIIGNSFVYKFLKNLDFDLFEDIFEMDVNPIEINTKDLVNTQLDVLNKFLSKDKLEIHEIYQKCKPRFIHNFENMIRYGQLQESHLKEYISKPVI